MKKRVCLGSLFDGIGGWPLAATKVGIEPVWASEIEEFPIAVTQKHFYDVKHLGDVTKINGAEIEPVDIITSGSPCQDLSIAGKRRGLDGERSCLFRESIRIVREMRTATEGKYPRFFVWENVPGAFSSNKRDDFRTVLEEITETKIPMPTSGRWATAGMVRGNGIEVAWRVLDAQYWGVPQRRKRIFLVADFRGQCASKILFEPESVSGYFTESSSKRERVARNIEDSVGKTILFEPRSQDGVPRIHDEICPTLNTAQGGQRQPCVAQVVRMRSGCEGSGKGALVSKECALTLATNNDMTVFQPIPINDKATRYKGGGDTRNNDGAGNGLGVGKAGDPMHTLTSCDRHAVAYPSTDYSGFINSEVAATLKACGGCLGGGSENLAVAIDYIVRRLTPTECERLQGLEDGYTALGSDTARYKALGNGMAQPCADFVMEGIARIYAD